MEYKSFPTKGNIKAINGRNKYKLIKKEDSHPMNTMVLQCLRKVEK